MAAQSVKFDRAVEYYDETRGFPPGEEKPIAAIIAKAGGLQSTNQVLEIGIGTGRIALPLSSHTHCYFGVDISRPMMQKLKGKQNGERVYPAEADATQLPFSDSCFDAAVAVHVFHLIPNWRGALDELARVLRPDAPLIHCWTKDNEDFRSLWNAWNAVVPTDSRRPGAQWQQNPDFLQDAGWKASPEIHNHAFTVQKTVNGFLSMIKNRLWSALWELSDEELARGLATIEPIIEANYPDRDKAIRSNTIFYARAFYPPAFSR